MGRILFLIRRYCPGEAWTNRTLAYAKAFAEEGEDVWLYFLISDKKRTHYNIDIPGVKVVNLFENDGFLAKKSRHLSFLKNLISFKRQVRPGDKVFVYGGYEYQLYIGNQIRHKAKVFCEITEHPSIRGNRRFIEGSNGRKIKLLKRIDGLFVISKSLKEYYISHGIDSGKIHIINMFVDVSRFDRLHKTTKEKYVAYCGAVSYDKDGCDSLIRAFEIFHRTHPSYKLYIIGKGIGETVIPSLQKLAKNLQISDCVKFTGAVSPEKVPQLLFDASILALSRPDNLQAKNGFPTKLGEYLATGNPVVVTKVGEIPDFIEHKVNGVLAEPCNSVDFAEKLCWIAENPVIAHNIGTKGKELVSDEFNSSVQAKKALKYLNRER